MRQCAFPTSGIECSVKLLCNKQVKQATTLRIRLRFVTAVSDAGNRCQPTIQPSQEAHDHTSLLRKL